MTISYIGPLRQGWERMVETLFRPFDVKKWFVMGFAAWLANLTYGGGGGGADGPEEISKAAESGLAEGVEEGLAQAVEAIRSLPGWILYAGAAGCVLVIAVVLLVLWVSARGKFIFLDNVVQNEGRIRLPWREYRREGDSLFGWLLFYVVVGVLIFGLVIGALAIAVLPAARSGAPDWPVITVAGAFLTVLIVAVAYLNLFLESFIVPIMFRHRVSAWSAWGRFLDLLRRHPGPLLLYGLFVLALLLLLAAAILALCLFTCCIGLILLAIPYIGTVLTLPVWVTFRAFSLHWLAQLDPDLDLFAVAGETRSLSE
jgi:hypothetical protein